MMWIVLLLLTTASFAQSVHPDSSHVHRDSQITLAASVETVFPLFAPMNEGKWAPGWQPMIKYRGNTDLGSVFTTGSTPRPAIWIVSLYDENSYFIQYTVVFAGDRVEQLDIRCQPSSAAESRCNIGESITALTDRGRAAVDKYTQQRHEQRIAHWQMAINHYLATGSRIKHHE
jgi:hypothetical protein